MKKMLFAFCVFTASITEAQTTNFYTTVTNLWYQGQKTEVLALGNERLNIYSNDMPGLIIKLVYDLEFLQLETISNSFIKVTSVGETITNENFQLRYPFLKESNDFMLELFTQNPFTPEELLLERAKGLIPHKPFALYKELEALQKDGLFEPLEP